MPVTIQIEDDDLDALKEFYVKKRIDLYKQANSIDLILNQLDHAPMLGNNASSKIIPTAGTHKEGYKTNWTWLKKIIYIVNQNDGEAGVSKIGEFIFSLEPSLSNRRKQTMASLSSILSTNSKEGGSEIFKKRPDENGILIYSVNEKKSHIA
jgi:hypothetical protein